MAISIHAWEVFSTVVECKSFAKAAQKLDLSVSTVSHMIVKLEEDCGCTLLTRNRNSVELTTNGSILYPYAKSLLQCNEAVEQTFSNLRNNTGGIVRIASLMSPAELWLPHIIHRFHDKYPGINVQLQQTTDAKIQELAEAGDVDLAFCLESSSVKTTFFPIHKTPVVCVAPPGYVPENGDRITASDLEGQPLILQIKGNYLPTIDFFNQHNITLQSTYHLESDYVCDTYVNEGFGFLITTQLTLQCDPRELNVFPLYPQSYYTFGLITSHPDYISPAAKLFRNEIFQYMSDEGLMNV